MWIIKLKFAGKDGTYTKEEESATDFFGQIVNTNECSQDGTTYYAQKLSALVDNHDLVLRVIQLNLSNLNEYDSNNGSTFEISMEEVLE